MKFHAPSLLWIGYCFEDNHAAKLIGAPKISPPASGRGNVTLTIATAAVAVGFVDRTACQRAHCCADDGAFGTTAATGDFTAGQATGHSTDHGAACALIATISAITAMVTIIVAVTIAVIAIIIMAAMRGCRDRKTGNQRSSSNHSAERFLDVHLLSPLLGRIAPNPPSNLFPVEQRIGDSV